MKVCTRCKQEKPETDFYEDKRFSGGIFCWCKQCSREFTYKWRTTNKGKESTRKTNKKSSKTPSVLLYRKEYRSKDDVKTAVRKSQLKILYDMTIEEYDEILKKQDGKCAICGSINKDGRRLFVDHNHRTGTVRGLLCKTCNFTLGMVEDSTDVLTKMISYLEQEGELCSSRIGVTGAHV